MRKTKITAIVLLLAFALLLCTGCAKEEAPAQNKQTEQTEQTEQTPATEEAKLYTAEDFFAATTKEELAAIANCDPEDMDQLLIYVNNLNKILPDADYKQPEKFERGVTEDEGLVWVTDDELKTMITPTVVTTENWKEFFDARITQQEWIDYDMDGNEISTMVDTPVFGLKDGYYCSFSDSELDFVNDKTGEEVYYSSGSWGEELRLEDGKVFTVSYDDEYNEILTEFNIDDYTCTKADCIVYKYDLPDEIISVSIEVEEDGETFYKNMPLSKCTQEHAESDEFVCIMYGDDAYPWYIGYSMVGEDVYTGSAHA